MATGGTPGLNGKAKWAVTVSVGGVLALVGFGVTAGRWVGTAEMAMELTQEMQRDLDQLKAQQAANSSMILNFAHRMDSLESRIEGVRIAPTGISAETRPRLDALDASFRELSTRLRELERGNR